MAILKQGAHIGAQSHLWAFSHARAILPPDTRPTPYTSKTITALFLLLGSLLLVSCGNNPTKPTTTETPLTTRQHADQLLTQARLEERQGEWTRAAEQRLTAAKILIEIGEPETAGHVLADIPSQRLSDEFLVDYALAYSDLALSRGDYFIAKRILTLPRLVAASGSFSIEDELHWRANRARMFTDTDEPILALREYLVLAPLLSDKQSEQANNDTIWQLLMGLPQETLNQRSATEPSKVLRGWFNLAAISKNNQANIELQLAEVQQWRTQWPNHPANLGLPDDLKLLQRLVQQQPKQVALLLPLTGKFASAGRAVRDGFLAAYYSNAEAGFSVPQLRVYNTDATDINALLDLAVAEGAETIIGPLQKEPLEQLAWRPAQAVPVLALNYLVDDLPPSDGLFQFGLAVEDEARQISERAWRDGHRRAMILASDRDWGQRSAQAFSQAWQELGGELAVYSEFALQSLFSETIERSLLVDRSKQRARDIRRLTGLALETEPRARGDVDMIFMVANPGDARQLKPTLAFHYAANVPVYATGHIFDPNASASENSDLNGIRFTSLPWYFGFSAHERDQLDRLIPSQKHLQNLHALGVDAFRLYPRLLQLQEVPSARYFGATGELFLTEKDRLARKQSLAVMSSGQALIVPTVAEGVIID